MTDEPPTTDETVVVTHDSQGAGGDDVDHQGSSAIEELVEKGPAHEFHEPQPHILAKTSGKLGTIALAVLVFYSVSGGPFGSEETIRSAGNFYTLLGFAIFPLIWSLQEALMTAELGAAFPEASGGVAWVEEAFGSNLAWITGWLGYIAGVTDNAIYPVLFLDYLLQVIGGTSGEAHLAPVGRFFLLAFTCVVLSLVNWFGLQIVGRISITVCLIAMSPFLILSLAGIAQVDTSRWLERPDPDTAAVVAATGADISGGFFPNATLGGILLRPYLNNLFWNLNSYNSAGTFAGDIEDPGRVLPRAMYISLVFVFFGYLIPLAVTLGASTATQTDWEDGYFAVAASDIVGPWLGVWMVFAAGVSNIALFQAELSTESFQLMGMAERGFVPKIFASRSRYDTPTAAIVLSTLFMVGMSSSNLEKLVELLNFNYAIGLLIEFTAFVKLRISEPNLSRPFRIPLNVSLCVVAMIPTFAASLAVMALAKYSTMLYSFLVNVAGGVVYIILSARLVGKDL